MYKTLCTHAINVTANNLDEAIRAAQIGGFDGLEIPIGAVADLVEQQGAEAAKKKFKDANIIPAGWGLPVDWRTTDENWQRDLEKLPRLAKTGAAVGATRVFTWVMPCSDERAIEENIPFHIARFKPIAQILADNRCALGLEFIGPKTLRESKKFPFVHTMQQMLDLGERIGPNVGLLLDAWHLYTSHGTLDDLRRVPAEKIVYVHVNDAPKGIAIDEQLDSIRALPGETGVIDIAGFLKTLKEIGYDGPITPEPFKKELTQLPSDEARLKTVGAAMDKIFHQAGISRPS